VVAVRQCAEKPLYFGVLFYSTSQKLSQSLLRRLFFFKTTELFESKK
jgi:hypothetical protein